MKEYLPAPFEVYPFIQNFFQDLSLTLPALGCQFKGTITPSDIWAEADQNHLKNKLFLLFIDMAGEEKVLEFKFTLTMHEKHLRLCFQPAQALKVFDHPEKLANWDPQLFQLFQTGDQPAGFCAEVDFGPERPDDRLPFDKIKLFEAYGDRTTARNLAVAFAKRAETLVHDLDGALAAGQVEESLRLAHTLKGAARSIFALPLSKQAHLIEMQARSGDLTGTDKLYAELVQVYADFQKFFSGETL